MRTVLDTDNLDDITGTDVPDFDVVAYYVDGEAGTATAEQITAFDARYPNKTHWTLSRKRGVKADWIDVESGAANGSDAGNDLKDGNVTGVYCNKDSWDGIKAQIGDTGYVGPVNWWIGDWDPTITEPLPGSQVTQVQSPSSNPPSPGHWDRSVADDTVLTDQPATPPETPGEGDVTESTNEPTTDATGGTINAPIVAAAGIPGGYWLVGADGGVFAFGTAVFWGSIPQRQAGKNTVAGPDGKPQEVDYVDGEGKPTKMPPLNKAIVAVFATDQNGYTLIAADGGVFNFGDATFHGAV